MSLNLDFSDVNVDGHDNLALNLESVDTEYGGFDNTEVDSYLTDKLVAAIGLGFAVDSVINARILESIGDDEYLEEAKSIKKTVVRKGKLIKKRVCKPGFHIDGMDCIKTSARDAIAFGRRAKKAAKTRSRHKTKPSTAKSLDRSLVIRARNRAKVSR